MASTRSLYYFTHPTCLVLALALIAVIALQGEAWASKKKAEQEAPTQADTSPPIVMPPELTPALVEKLRGEALVKELDEGTTPHWLAEAGDVTFLALLHNNLSSTNNGTILLLPDNQSHPDWRGAAHYLRTHLVNAGWSTLSIALPDYLSVTDIPPRTVSAEPSANDTKDDDTKSAQTKSTQTKSAQKDNKKETDKEAADTPPPPAPSTKEPPAKPESPIEERTNSRINEALSFINSQKSKGPAVVVIAVGLSAQWITHYINSNSGQTKIDGIIFIDGHGEKSLKKLNVTKSIVELKFPVLDITSQHDKGFQEAKERRSIAKKEKLSQYQYIELNAPSQLRNQEEELFRRSKGWLKKVFEQSGKT